MVSDFFFKKQFAIIPDTYTPLFDAKQPLSWEAGICGMSNLLTKTAEHFLEANKQNSIRFFFEKNKLQ